MKTLAVIFNNKVNTFTSFNIQGEQLFDLYDIQVNLIEKEGPAYLDLFEHIGVTFYEGCLYGNFDVANDYIVFITEGKTKAVDQPLTVTVDGDCFELPSLFLNGEVTYNIDTLHQNLYFGSEDTEPSKFIGSGHSCYLPKMRLFEYLNWCKGWIK